MVGKCWYMSHCGAASLNLSAPQWEGLFEQLCNRAIQMTYYVATVLSLSIPVQQLTCKVL